ncbi:hypothetical protein [Aequitasia blattaphilus]|uniref:Uncharacterized protein n=1 Tax=Aequitasia blattaphilus TaxID=2949332 RepID=A0ABT1ED53_9FIRM|nr:hypothetical protein [Aequitasia blattaphilus]MCP1103763.1 hypothetical protein [Aequitasia blattaphilus]MCR8616403.1 hypothetical protein [Aequitasia blattaphilus]
MQDGVAQILLTLAGGEIGLLGISLAGIAIIVSLLSPELNALLLKIDKNDVVNRTLSHFEFSALNLCVQIIYFVCIYLVICSPQVGLSENVFNILFVLVTYHFIFNMLYILALIGNCIEINNIKNGVNNIIKSSKTTVDIANELRIDYLLALMLRDKDIDRDEYLRELDKMIDNTNIANSSEVKQYLKNYYGIKKQ